MAVIENHTNGRRPTSPLQHLMETTTTITPSPRARKSKRKISKAQFEIELSLSSKKNKLAEDELKKERADREILLKQKDRLLRQHSKDKTTMGILGDLLIESRKTGRKYAAELKSLKSKDDELEQKMDGIVYMNETEKEVSSLFVHSSAPLSNTQSKVLLSCTTFPRPPLKMLPLQKTTSVHLSSRSWKRQSKPPNRKKHKSQTKALVKGIVSRKDTEKEVSYRFVHSSAPPLNTHSIVTLSCYIFHRPPSKIS